MKKSNNNLFIFIGILVLLLGFLYYIVNKGISYYIGTKNKEKIVQVANCTTENKFALDELTKSTEWSITNRKPAVDQTLTDLPVYVPFQGSDLLVGYKSNLVGTYLLRELTTILDSKKVDEFITKKLIPEYTKAGYMVDRQSSDNTYGINSALTVEKDKKLVNIHIYENDKSVFFVDINCAENIEPQTKIFKLLATHQAFNATKNTSTEVWDNKDNVYVINVFPKGSLAGHVIYTTSINNSWENLYEGQETPNCDIFESKKIGKGLDCYDQNTKNRRQVSYQ